MHSARMMTAGLVAAATLTAATAVAGAEASPYRVTSAADTGPGTLRHALASGAESILLDESVDEITLASPLVWEGTTLRIQGHGQTIDASSVTNGLYLAVPADATGTVSIELRDIGVVDSKEHGIHIDDEGDDDTGSAAGVDLALHGVRLFNNGNGDFDQDGVRVDERGDGSVSMTVRRSTIQRSGADGIELDEGGPGDVVVDLQGSDLSENGWNDPGDDPDDGIDVDEAGAGSVVASIRASTFDGNYDEGIDLNELDDGSLLLDLVATSVVGTMEGDGVGLEELGDGIVTASVRSTTIVGSGDDGIDGESNTADGSTLELRGSDVSDNDDDDIALDNIVLT